MALLCWDLYSGISSELLLRLQDGWSCPQCTFINEPTRPGCEACCADRPSDYEVPVGYLPSEAEQTRLDRERALEQVAVRIYVSQKNVHLFIFQITLSKINRF